MTNAKPETTPTRINPFAEAELDEFKPKTKPTPRATSEQINAVAEQTGFPSRQPVTSEPVRRVRRYTTGRNQQLNLKVTENTLKRFYAIADELNLPLGEVFDQAVKALENTR